MRRGVMCVMVAIAWPHGVDAEPDGRITIERAVNGNSRRSTANAGFASSDIWGAVIGNDGHCTVHAKLPLGQLSAGTIEITGTSEPITLEPRMQRVGQMFATDYHAMTRLPAFTDGATITVQAAGGADVPAFSATLTAPTALAGYTPPTSLSRRGYTATWTAGNAQILIVIAAVNEATGHASLAVCLVPDTGTFTIPPSTFDMVPSGDDHVIVSVGRVAESIQRVGEGRVVIDVIDNVLSGPFLLTYDRPVERSQDRSLLAEADRPDSSPRLFVSFGFGVGGFSRVADAPPTRWGAFRLQVGQRLSHGFHVVEDLDFPGSSYVSDDTLEEQLAMGAGVRWSPFEPEQRVGIPARFFPGHFVRRRLYATATVGTVLRSRVTSTSPVQPAMSESDKWSPMASVALGLPVIEGEDWLLSIEFREQLARFDGEFQRGWQLLYALDLNGW